MCRSMDGTNRRKWAVPRGTALKRSAGSVRELLLQCADVGNQVVDLRVGQLAFVSRHLAFAVGNGGRQVGIRHLLDVGAAEVLGSHRGLAAAIGAMAHGALCLVRVRTALRHGYRRQCQSDQCQSDHQAEQSDTLKQSHRLSLSFPHQSPLRGKIWTKAPQNCGDGNVLSEAAFRYTYSVAKRGK